MNKRSNAVEPVSRNGPLIRQQDHITALQQLELRLSVRATEGEEVMDFETLSFYKAISNSLRRLLDNPDTVHLLQQRGFLGFISIFSSIFFSFFFAQGGRSAGAQRE